MSSPSVELVNISSGVGTMLGLSPEEMLVYQARVSSLKPPEELVKNPAKLLGYCMKNGHWSVFEMVSLGFKVTTSRAMAMEILRHRSLHFQMFSQRYADSVDMQDVELRSQDDKNRQNSVVKPFPYYVPGLVDAALADAAYYYNRLRDLGVASEVARFVLPECTTTTIYMHGTLRDILSFLNQRLHKSAQKEIRLVAQGIVPYILEYFPAISEAVDFNQAQDIPIFDQLILKKHEKET